MRSRYVIGVDAIYTVPWVMLPAEMTRWLTSPEYREQKMSYPDYCESKGYRVELGPGAKLVTGKVSQYVKRER